MKIKILVPFVTTTWGGSHNSSADLFSAINKYSGKNYDILILLPTYSLSKHVFEDNKLNVIEYKNQTNIAGILEPLNYFFLFLQAFIHLIKIKPNLIDTQDSQTLFLWGIPAKLLGIKIVWHSRQFSENFFLTLLRIFIADFIICLGEKDQVYKLNRKKTSVIQNIYDPYFLKSIKPLPRKEIIEKQNIDSKLILCIGNISQRKRQAWVVNLSNDLKKIGIKVMILFIGDDNNDYAQKIKKIPLIDRESVKYLGVMSRFDTLRMIKTADLIVHASSSEAGPRVVYESLLLNKKVVSTNVGNLNSIIDNNLIISYKNSYQDFCAKVIEMISQKKISKKKLSLKNFAPREVVNKTVSIYEELLI